MSLLFLDGFDHYTVIDEKWDAQAFAGNFLISHDEGRFTPGAIKVKGTGGGGAIAKNITSSVEVIAGFAHNNINADIYDGYWAFTDNLGGLAILLVNASTGIGTFTYNGETVVTAAAVFTGSVWEHIEMRVKAHDSLGEMEIRRNGSTVGSGINLDTFPAGFEGFVTFSIGATHNSMVHYTDDLYVLNTEGTVNNTFAGDTRITALRPNANGLDNNFTPFGAATNFEAVDDLQHDQDATYVEAGQTGAKESYNNFDFSDLGISPGTIYGVQVVNAAKKTDAGQLKYKDQMIVGGIPYDNGAEVIATSGTYQMTFMIRDTDPSDNGTWSEAKVAALGSGLEITFREV
tara:strand:+ start:882 stop:1919 length:1038 start_codon:yes stop_codon:yes gene_type:complete